MVTLAKPPGEGVCVVELLATLEATRAARSYVVDVLTGWGVPGDYVDTARLLTSELVTNAITHGSPRGTVFTLAVRSFSCCLSVEVVDGSQGVPIVRIPANDAQTGRGLLLVARLADSWGYFFDGGRKHVWFHLSVTDRTPPPASGVVVPAA
jgi:anti-sigma regulatory factor (Ser/Thr protein kinase)